MKKLIILILVLGVFVSCQKSPSEKNIVIQELSQNDNSENAKSTQQNDVRDIIKDWRIDNPNLPEYMMDLDYGVEHSLSVRMYDERPDAEDYADNSDSYRIFNIDNFVIYSRWRGEVYAYNKETGKYFLIWSESMNYNSKMIENMGDGWIRIIYMESCDMNDMTDAVIYNLNTHKYYFKNIHNDYCGESF